LPKQYERFNSGRPSILSVITTNVIADRAYNYAKPEYRILALRELQIEPVFDLHTNQRSVRPGPTSHTILVDGIIFADSWPEHLREPPYPKYSTEHPSTNETESAHSTNYALAYAYRLFELERAVPGQGCCVSLT